MVGCSAPTPKPPLPPDSTAPAPVSSASDPANNVMERRAFPPLRDGEPLRRGIGYGPHREGQKPGGPDPTPTQIREDLELIAKRWQMLRFYGSRGPAETILRTIREQELPLSVVVGAWIAPDDEPENQAEVEAAIALAKSYPEEVIAVAVGNETQIAWSGHRSDREDLIRYLRRVREAVTQPVTTADDYNFWNKPESHAVADEIDFILLHAYAMWNGQRLEQAVPWTETTVASIRNEHPGIPIALGETGWATELNPDGDEVKHIKAPAGEAQQKTFFDAFSHWADEAGLPYFYFEAFDEPWKGSDDPREVEKHWGLYHVDRTPKAALKGATP